MFGYVIPFKDRLNEQQLNRYRGCYCGLCRALQTSYGGLSRMALNYDMTFLVMVLSSLYEPEESDGAARCTAHPAKPQPFWQNRYTDYAADLTIALTYHKLRDDWLDEGSQLKKSLMHQFQGAYDKAKSRLPRQCAAMEEQLEALHALEQKKDPVPDDGAACFGRLMAELFVPEEDRWAPALREAAYFLGEFIYLQDACIDLQKDAKKGAYNPLLLMSGGTVRPVSDFEPMLLMLAGQCAAAFDRLPLVQDADILNNILYEGIWTRYHETRARQQSQEKHTEEQ